MNRIVHLPEKERKALFTKVAAKMDFNNAMVEKDFWVCFILDYLFHRCQWKDNFTFKGGTSLSKCYNLIKRFSEDIDLILDWRVLEYGINEPWEARSSNQQDKFNKEANLRAEKFLEEKFIPIIKNDISKELGIEANIYADKQAVNFVYPNIFADSYNLPYIRLEIGPLAAWTPAKIVSIQSYAGQYFPELFLEKDFSVLAVAPERTFWEKATILHHEANRPENLDIPVRYFRHYYDLYCMYHSNTKEQAFLQIDLLNVVVNFKMKFYPRKWANYNDAALGKLKLIPPEYRYPSLRADYKNMKEMFYGDIPDFGLIMDDIRKLETEINNLRI